MILLTCRALAILLRYVRQPAVIAEVVGGIVLGPSVFGLIPGYMDTLFPKESLPLLSVIAQLGLVFYLFLVGLELDLELVKVAASIEESVACCCALVFNLILHDTMTWLSNIP